MSCQGMVVDLGIRRKKGAEGQEAAESSEADWDDTGSFWVLTALVERVLPAYYNDLSGVAQDVRESLRELVAMSCASLMLAHERSWVP
jgi:hypothetical protein